MLANKWNKQYDSTLIKWGSIVIIIITVMGILMALKAGGRTIKSDAEGYYVHLRSLIIDGDLYYQNEYTEYCQDHFTLHADDVTITGHVVNKSFIGPAILWFPFFILAHILTLIFGYFGSTLQPDGFSFIYQLIVGLSSGIYGLSGLYLMYRLLKRWFLQINAFYATALVFAGTNLIYYMTIEPCMTHAMSLFSVLLFFNLWLDKEKIWGGFAWCGLSIGLMFLIRPQNILFIVVLIPFIYQSLSKWQLPNILWLFKAAMVAVATIVPQLVVWKILYGHFFTYSYSGETFDFLHPVFIKSMISPMHGLIQWTPIIAIGLLGLLCAVKNRVEWAMILLVCFILQWYVNASWWSWWFGHGFGNRAYINCSIVFAFGLAYLLQNLKKFRPIFIGLVILLTLNNILIMLFASSSFFFGEGPYTYWELLSGSVKLIPEIIYKVIDNLGL